MVGFMPICDANSKILILGSFPSEISRKNNIYYGNKRNRFWKLISNYFGVPLVTVEDKIQIILKNHIALWDIVSSCEVQGSLDQNIKHETINNIIEFLHEHKNIKAVFCNGKLSYKLTQKYFNDNDFDFPLIYLPSTSPANVTFDENVWFENLKLWLS